MMRDTSYAKTCENLNFFRYSLMILRSNKTFNNYNFRCVYGCHFGFVNMLNMINFRFAL